jgi:type II secretory pathway pseudopilin PulG
MVVMIIMGVLVTLGISAFTSSQTKSRDLRRKGDIRAISEALEAYYSDKGRYPEGQTGDMYGCLGAQVCAWGAQWQDDLGTIYMTKLPADPGSTKYRYYYVAPSTGRSYKLYVHLENSLDPDGQTNYLSGGQCGGGATSVFCNCGVSSQNTTL